MALLFGLRSSPQNLSCGQCTGVLLRASTTWTIIFFGPPGSDACSHNLSRALATCENLGVPVALHKLDGPGSVITFSGLEIDTVRGMLRLPDDKLSRLHSSLKGWESRKACTKRELLSLHVATVVKQGSSFLRRLIDLAHLFQRNYTLLYTPEPGCSFRYFMVVDICGSLERPRPSSLLESFPSHCFCPIPGAAGPY